MRQMSSPLNQALITSENPEDILGQYYFAFGQGAGSMRVQRSAIAALRSRYLPAIQRAPGSWSDAAGSVLSLMAQVGRLAALLATQSGRTAINDVDFTHARVAVETQVHGRNGQAGLLAGPWCTAQREDSHPIPEVEAVSHGPAVTTFEAGTLPASQIN
jgi:hypothetical protein